MHRIRSIILGGLYILMKRFFKAVITTVVSMQIFSVTAFAYEKAGKLEELEYSIYKHLENRDRNFTILYTGERIGFKDNALNCIKNAYSKDDYLERSWLEIRPVAKVTQEGIETTFDVTYLTTKEQEEYIDRELRKITESLINPNMSDLDKVKVINNYIINRYDYDNTQKSIDVYSALTSSITVCQGYSMTAYKMFNYAGIENRIIIGRIKDTPHSWNLVKIQGNWYQLDITNNDSIEINKYFLISDETLISKGYIWDANKYPKAYKKYDDA